MCGHKARQWSKGQVFQVMAGEQPLVMKRLYLECDFDLPRAFFYLSDSLRWVDERVFPHLPFSPLQSLFATGTWGGGCFPLKLELTS